MSNRRLPLGDRKLLSVNDDFQNRAKGLYGVNLFCCPYVIYVCTHNFSVTDCSSSIYEMSLNSVDRQRQSLSQHPFVVSRLLEYDMLFNENKEVSSILQIFKACVLQYAICIRL